MSYNIPETPDGGKAAFRLDGKTYLLLEKHAYLEGIGPAALLERIAASATEEEALPDPEE